MINLRNLKQPLFNILLKFSFINTNKKERTNLDSIIIKMLNKI